jgi:hypothetical protein
MVVCAQPQGEDGGRKRGAEFAARGAQPEGECLRSFRQGTTLLEEETPQTLLSDGAAGRARQSKRKRCCSAPRRTPPRW